MFITYSAGVEHFAVFPIGGVVLRILPLTLPMPSAVWSFTTKLLPMPGALNEAKGIMVGTFGCLLFYHFTCKSDCPDSDYYTTAPFIDFIFLCFSLPRMCYVRIKVDST